MCRIWKVQSDDSNLRRDCDVAEEHQHWVDEEDNEYSLCLECGRMHTVCFDCDKASKLPDAVSVVRAMQVS